MQTYASQPDGTPKGGRRIYIYISNCPAGQPRHRAVPWDSCNKTRWSSRVFFFPPQGHKVFLRSVFIVFLWFGVPRGTIVEAFSGRKGYQHGAKMAPKLVPEGYWGHLGTMLAPKSPQVSRKTPQCKKSDLATPPPGLPFGLHFGTFAVFFAVFLRVPCRHQFRSPPGAAF